MKSVKGAEKRWWDESRQTSAAKNNKISVYLNQPILNGTEADKKKRNHSHMCVFYIIVLKTKPK